MTIYNINRYKLFFIHGIIFYDGGHHILGSLASKQTVSYVLRTSRCFLILSLSAMFMESKTWQSGQVIKSIKNVWIILMVSRIYCTIRALHVCTDNMPMSLKRIHLVIAYKEASKLARPFFGCGSKGDTVQCLCRVVKTSSRSHSRAVTWCW